MAHSPNTVRVIRSLEKAVNTAFLMADITKEDLIRGPIVFTELPWQNPPLFSLHNLAGVPLTMYLNSPVSLYEAEILPFWLNCMTLLYHDPTKALEKDELYKGSTKLLYGEQKSSHRFRFSIPEGYPRPTDEYAGAMLSMELADLISQSLPYELIRDENNYYVTLSDGRMVGIVGGLPAIDSGWDTSVMGIVWDLAEMLRGRVDSTCRYDALAKARSLLHENRKSFKEFEGIDQALQALRILYLKDGDCTILNHAVKLKKAEPDFKEQRSSLLAAIATMYRQDISDRAKLDIMYVQLVPDTFSESKFGVKIYSVRQKAPYTLSDSAVSRILANLREAVDRLPITTKV